MPNYFDTVSWEPMREMFRRVDERRESDERIRLALMDYALRVRLDPTMPRNEVRLETPMQEVRIVNIGKGKP